MNKLLKQQAADYFTTSNQIDPAIIKLLHMISDTYDYFEEKLSAHVSPETKKQELTPQKEQNIEKMKGPFGYAQLIRQATFKLPPR
jgi:hypothetical protein